MFRFVKFIPVFSFLLCMGSVPAPCVVIPAEDIQSAILKHLNESYAGSGYDVEFAVTVTAQVSLPQVENTVLTITHEPVKFPARLVPVNICVKDQDGTVLKQIRQSARVKMFASAAVAAKDIMRDETIAADAVEIRRVEVTNYTDYFESLDGLAGLQSKKILRAGSVLTADDIRQAFLIERGDQVNVEVRDSALTLRTLGTARQGGALGQSISVYIDMTKTVVTGIIIDSHTVLTGASGG